MIAVSNQTKELEMRKIEEQMLQAIYNRKDFKSDNTSVTIYKNAKPSNAYHAHHAYVYLHGNKIAAIDYLNDSLLHVRVDTLREWPTPTTKSRLRALGADVQSVKGQTLLDGQNILAPHMQVKFYPPIGVSTQTVPAQPEQEQEYSIFDERRYA